jgi:hypothetical protein
MFVITSWHKEFGKGCFEGFEEDGPWFGEGFSKHAKVYKFRGHALTQLKRIKSVGMSAEIEELTGEWAERYSARNAEVV